MRVSQWLFGVLILAATPAASAASWQCDFLHDPLRSGDIFLWFETQPQVRPDALVDRTLFTLGWCPSEVYDTFSWSASIFSYWTENFNSYAQALIDDPQSNEIRQFLDELSTWLAIQPTEAEYHKVKQTLLEALRENPLTQSSTSPEVDPVEASETATYSPCGIIARRVIEEATENWRSTDGPEHAAFSDDLVFLLSSCPDAFYSVVTREPKMLSSWLKELPESSFTGDPVLYFEAARLTLVVSLLRHSTLTPAEYRDIEAAIILRLQEFEAKPIYVP